jgi:hypothetical protein
MPGVNGVSAHLIFLALRATARGMVDSSPYCEMPCEDLAQLCERFGTGRMDECPCESELSAGGRPLCLTGLSCGARLASVMALPAFPVASQPVVPLSLPDADTGPGPGPGPGAVAGSGFSRSSDGDECLLAALCEQRCGLKVTPSYCHCAPPVLEASTAT